MSRIRTVNPDPVFLYVLSSNDGPVKVGVARNPLRRVGQVQTGNPYPVQLACALGPVDRSRAVEIEREAHDLLNDWRLTGEWFSCGEQLAMDALVNAGWHP